MTGSEVVAFRESATLIASAIQGVVQVYRQNRTVSRTRIDLLRVEGNRAIALALAAARGEIARANVQEIVDTARLIDALPPESIGVQFAIDQLEHLNRSLRRILDDF